MLKKMKARLKNEKGFTLVELLAVIAILAIIVAIAIPSIGNVISKSENKADEANIKLIENAARLADVSDDFPEEGMTVENLHSAGYLEEVPEDPKGKGMVYTGEVTKNENGAFKYEKKTQKKPAATQ